jgi:hypothetical protein
MPDYDIAIAYKASQIGDQVVISEIVHVSAEPHTLADVIASCGCFDDQDFKNILQLTVYNKSEPVKPKDQKPTGTPSAQPSEP